MNSVTAVHVELDYVQAQNEIIYQIYYSPISFELLMEQLIKLIKISGKKCTKGYFLSYSVVVLVVLISIVFSGCLL